MGTEGGAEGGVEGGVEGGAEGAAEGRGGVSGAPVKAAGATGDCSPPSSASAANALS
jgi:hypothetical protein